MKGRAMGLAVGCYCLAGLAGGCFTGVAGGCFTGLAGSNTLFFRAKPEYIVSAGQNGQGDYPGTSRAFRENVGEPADVQNLAFCQAADAVHIRQEPTTASAVVGKIHRNAAANVLAAVNGEGGSWYRIQSGTVSGYVKASYFVTGVQAEEIAREVGICYASIHTAALRLREKPNVSSPVLTTLRQGTEYVMLGEENHFAKLAVDDILTGYASMDYIKTRMVYPQAVSAAEEAVQQADEARRQQEAQTALLKLEEVKLVEAKNDSGRENSFASVTMIPGAQEVLQGTIAANPLGQGDNPQVQAPGTAPTLSGIAVVWSKGPGEGSALGETNLPGTVSPYGPGGGASQELVSAARIALVAYAKQFLGYPYVYGGDSLTNGSDCSGFVMRIFEHFGIATGRSSREQAGNGRQIAVEAVKPGDLLFYASGDTINHVAIYIGGGQIIHAASARTGVTISPADYRTACRAVSFFD